MGYTLPDPLREIRELASKNAALISLSRAYEQSSLFDGVHQIERMHRNLFEMTTLVDNTRLAQQLQSITNVDSNALKELADGFTCRGLLAQLDTNRETLANQASRIRRDLSTSLIETTAYQSLRQHIDSHYTPLLQVAAECSKRFALNVPSRQCSDTDDENRAWDAIQSSPGEWELSSGVEDATEPNHTDERREPAVSVYADPVAVIFSAAVPVSEYLGFSVTPTPPRIACMGNPVDGSLICEVRQHNGRMLFKLVGAGSVCQHLIWPIQQCEAQLSLTFRLRNNVAANNDEIY